VVSSYLANTLDRGEAAVIQTALNLNIPLVCIDEAVGRRVARLSDLSLTGSIGVLLKAKQLGYEVSMAQAVSRMREHGIWLSAEVIRFALQELH
jgi:predicted nucleic acid-binding protein